MVPTCSSIDCALPGPLNAGVTILTKLLTVRICRFNKLWWSSSFQSYFFCLCQNIFDNGFGYHISWTCSTFLGSYNYPLHISDVLTRFQNSDYLTSYRFCWCFRLLLFWIPLFSNDGFQEDDKDKLFSFCVNFHVRNPMDPFVICYMCLN